MNLLLQIKQAQNLIVSLAKPVKPDLAAHLAAWLLPCINSNKTGMELFL